MNTDPNYYDATTGRMLDLDVLRSLFDEQLDGRHEPVESRLGWSTVRLKMSAFLKAADRPMYDLTFNNWADAEVKAGRLSVGPPEVTYQVALDLGEMEATSPVEAARKVAAMLAGHGADGYAWRAVYDVTAPDSTEHSVDLVVEGSGRTCMTCEAVDDGGAEVSDSGTCYRQIDGHVCGGRMVWTS